MPQKKPTKTGLSYKDAGVDIDNATTWANCHVIGGHYTTATKVRDTYNRLTTNSFP